MSGEREDYRRLIESHQQRLVGWFRVRVGDPDLAADLTQRTWVEVLERIHTFDPERGSFWTFTKIWAQFVLRRHYTETKRFWVHHQAGQEESAGEPDGVPLDAAWSWSLKSTDPSGGPDIERVLHASEVLLELLQHVLRCRRLPHEVVVFGYVKLLQWKPKRVVGELSDSDLQGLTERLEDEYFRCVPLPEVKGAFAALRVTLSGRLGECDVDQRVTGRYRDLVDRVVGTTLLRDYYPQTGTREEAVTRWWASVNRVVEEDLLRLSTGPLAELLRERNFRPRARGKK